MTKIAIIGHTIAGMKFAEGIRAVSPSTEIILFTLGHERPYARQQLSGYCAGLVTDEQMFPRPKGYAQKLGMLCIDQKILRVNLKKGVVVTEDKQNFEFDTLVVTDAELAKPVEIKGANKEGVFSLWGVPDVEEFSQALRLAETVVIQLDSLAALKMAAAARQKNIEVIAVTAGKNILPAYFDEPSAQILSGALESAGVRVMTENEIQEILGDNEAKAVRLRSGKVIGCQLVVLGQGRPDLRVWKDAGLNVDERITVDRRFCAAAPNVFALDSVCDFGLKSGTEDFDSYAAVVEAQGEALARIVAGADGFFEVPVQAVRFAIGDNIFDLAGTPSQGTEAFAHETAAEGRKVYRRVCARDGKIAGAVLMNVPAQADVLLDLIRRQADARGALLEIFTQGSSGETAPEVPAEETAACLEPAPA